MVWHCAKLLKLKTSLVLGNDSGVCGCVTCDTTGMESTKCQLCSWLTDSLCCDDTYCLTLLYHAGCGEVAAVTLAADTGTRLTCED